MLSQVGLGTETPRGMLDISSNDAGLVIPRVSSVEVVTDGNGGDPVDGTVVFDISRGKTCFRIDKRWVCMGDDGSGSSTISPIFTCSDITYVKTDVTNTNDLFGRQDFALSHDGTTLAIGNPNEDSNSTGVNGDATDNSAADAGAVYIFIKSSGVWQLEAYIKASNTEASDFFGFSVSLSDNGNLLAVGAIGEDSSTTGFNGNQNDNGISSAGAVYIFQRSGGIWSQQGYLKPDSNTADTNGQGTNFGIFVDFDSNGTTLAVGANFDDSEATGINGDPLGINAIGSGAAYVFYFNAGIWVQEAYIKPDVVGTQDKFGFQVKISDNGERLLVGANSEDSNATGINGDQNDNSLNNSGAVYIFDKSGGSWIQEAFIKASNPSSGDTFGTYLAINSDLTEFAVGVPNEASNATGINGDGSDNSLGFSGAVYVFRKSGGTWNEEAYIKAAFQRVAFFGWYIAMNKTGDKLVVGASRDSSNATCFDGDQEDTGSSASGAVYVFGFDGASWNQQQYIKSSNTGVNDNFGEGLGISGDGSTIAIGAPREDSNATGINGNQSNNSTFNSGAVYIIE